ncbi:hypothetical protein BGX29_004666 [Mortierella sp. GBA35]|nr:hypothetical protein BGX29_004666 [Mortierella sp. GBA35]
MVNNPPTLDQCIALFPRLESLGLHFNASQVSPDFSTVATSLREHEQQHGKQHPLRDLRITGIFPCLRKVLLEALMLGPSTLESLAITKLAFHHTAAASKPAPVFSTDLLTAPWCCLHSLTNLDINTIRFPGPASTMQFFTRLQDFNRLRALSLSLCHLRDLITDMVGQPDSTLVDFSRPNRNALQLTTLGLCYPRIRSLKLTPLPSTPASIQTTAGESAISIPEIRLLVDTAISLTYLNITDTKWGNAEYQDNAFPSKVYIN